MAGWVAPAILSALSMFASWKGAEAGKSGAYAQADEYFTLGDETIATAKANVRDREKNRYLTELDIQEKAQQDINFATDQGRRNYATMESDFSSSGAVIGEGSPMEALSNQALQSTMQTMGIAQSAEKGIGALRYQTDLANLGEMRNARTRANQYYRQGELTREGAGSQYMADMLGGVIGAGTTFLSLT